MQNMTSGSKLVEVWKFNEEWPQQNISGELDAPPFLVRNSQISSAKGLFIIITRRSRHAFATFAGAPCAQMVVTKETTEIVM